MSYVDPLQSYPLHLLALAFSVHLHCFSSVHSALHNKRIANKRTFKKVSVSCPYLAPDSAASYSRIWGYTTQNFTVVQRQMNSIAIAPSICGPRICGKLFIRTYSGKNGRKFRLYSYSHITTFAFPYLNSNFEHHINGSFEKCLPNRVLQEWLHLLYFSLD